MKVKTNRKKNQNQRQFLLHHNHHFLLPQQQQQQHSIPLPLLFPTPPPIPASTPTLVPFPREILPPSSIPLTPSLVYHPTPYFPWTSPPPHPHPSNLQQKPVHAGDGCVLCFQAIAARSPKPFRLHKLPLSPARLPSFRPPFVDCLSTCTPSVEAVSSGTASTTETSSNFTDYELLQPRSRMLSASFSPSWSSHVTNPPDRFHEQCQCRSVLLPAGKQRRWCRERSGPLAPVVVFIVES